MVQSPTLGERWLHTWKVPLFDEAGNPDILLGFHWILRSQKNYKKTSKIIV